jgi:antirestriction protein
MISFKSYLEEAVGTGKNTHMTHLDDAVIYGGVDGARQAINALRALRDMLAGHAKGSYDVTVKWDGAPAVFAGTDPRDGEFFVAKKGVFNKNPKVYKTNAEVDADTSGDLADKLKICLAELPKLGIKGVVQGDLMFTKSDLKKETIDGEKYITFQPNTIVYAVPEKTKSAAELKRAKMGIVFHTRYTGSSFENMKPSYDVKITEFKSTPSVWVQDAQLRDVSGTATLTASDTKEVTAALSIAGKIFQKIAGSTLREISNNPELARTIETYNNTFVRANTPIKNTSKHVDGLINYIKKKYEKEIESRKSEKGKVAQRQKMEEFLKFFSPQNKANLKLMFDLQKALVEAKLIIIKKLSKLNDLSTFARTATGFKTTGVEGYVAIDRLSGGALKLVDRLEFSYLNFSPEIIKGWQKT